MHGQGLVSYAIILVVVVAFMALRLRRMSRGQPLRLERLWILPALILVVTVLLIAQAPPTGLAWLWMALALAVGGGLGWVRGRTMTIAVDPETHALNMRASAGAMIFLAALVVARFGLRSALTSNAGALHLKAAAVTDLFAMFALGLFAVQRLEMAMRARRLLAQARSTS